MASASMIYNTSETICRNRASVRVVFLFVSLEIKATDIISYLVGLLSKVKAI
jgi:hypothetical protein